MKNYVTKNGKTIVLLNPHEKANKAREENASGLKITNDGVFKTGKDGNFIQLNNKERAYRAGYANARQDMVKAYAPESKKKAYAKTKQAMASNRGI